MTEPSDDDVRRPPKSYASMVDLSDAVIHLVDAGVPRDVIGQVFDVALPHIAAAFAERIRVDCAFPPPAVAEHMDGWSGGVGAAALCVAITRSWGSL